MNAFDREIVGFVIIVEENAEATVSQDICVPCEGGWIYLRTKPIFAKKQDPDE